MKKIISIFIMAVAIASCSSDRIELSITFVFDKPLNSTDSKYPQYFKDLTVPFISNCDMDYLLKPINISRIDISNKEIETNAWYFKDMGDNTVEFSKGWLEQYFKDSLLNNYLLQPSAKQVSIESWIASSKDSLYIFSEDAEVSEFNGRPVFNNTKDLNKKIQESACKNSTGRILILVNPSGISTTQKAPEVTETVTTISKPETKPKSGTEPPPQLKKIPIGDYATFEGSLNSKGEMCSKDARLVFKKRAQIDTNDPDQRFAEIGDFVVGEWINGHLSHGKWFDSTGKMKESILLGTTGVCDK